MNSQLRKNIKEEIDFWANKEKSLNAPFLYLLRRTRLQSELDWDDYLTNGCSKEDEKLFEEIGRLHPRS
jgi:hypothetical protein